MFCFSRSLLPIISLPTCFFCTTREGSQRHSPFTVRVDFGIHFARTTRFVILWSFLFFLPFLEVDFANGNTRGWLLLERHPIKIIQDNTLVLQSPLNISFLFLFFFFFLCLLCLPVSVFFNEKKMVFDGATRMVNKILSQVWIPNFSNHLVLSPTERKVQVIGMTKLMCESAEVSQMVFEAKPVYVCPYE